MSAVFHDLKGLKCPQPTLKMTILVNSIPKGSVLEVVADCPTFEKDVKSWCERMRRTFLWIKDEGNGAKRCQVQL